MRDMTEAKEAVTMLTKEILGQWKAAPAIWTGDPELGAREKLVERFVQQLDGHTVQFVAYVPGVGDVLIPEHPMRFSGEDLADPSDPYAGAWVLQSQTEVSDKTNGTRMLHVRCDLRALMVTPRWNGLDMVDGINGPGLFITSLHTEQATYGDQGGVKLRIRVTLSPHNAATLPLLHTMGDTLEGLIDLGVRGEVTVNDGYIPSMASSIMDVVALTGLPQNKVAVVCQGRVALDEMPYGTAVRLSQYASISHLRGRIHDVMSEAFTLEILGDGAHVVVTTRDEGGDRRFMYEGALGVDATMLDLMVKRRTDEALVLEQAQQLDGAPVQDAFIVVPWSQVHQVAVEFDDASS